MTGEGLITYMRTDSTALSQRALTEAQQVIGKQFGPEYADGPRTYKTKSKGAQEAHEAIRPTHLANTPDKVRGVLSQDEARLYELIWRRTMASQMPDARLLRTTADIQPRTTDGGDPATFRATGQSVDFPGWMQPGEVQPERTTRHCCRTWPRKRTRSGRRRTGG